MRIDKVSARYLPCAKGGGSTHGLPEGLSIPQSRCSRDSPFYTRGPFTHSKKLLILQTSNAGRVEISVT